jgi:hypothetical protein
LSTGKDNDLIAIKALSVNWFLRESGVTIISSGLDEVPMAYKNIREVMQAQRDLVVRALIFINNRLEGNALHTIAAVLASDE